MLEIQSKMQEGYHVIGTQRLLNFLKPGKGDKLPVTLLPNSLHIEIIHAECNREPK
jgi:hypothetical protein